MNPIERMARSLAMHEAGDVLGYDEVTRQALTHLDVFVDGMLTKSLTWADIPRKLSSGYFLEGMPQAGNLGGVILELMNADDSFKRVRSAIDTGQDRGALLGLYSSVIEIAFPDEAQSVQALQDGSL